MLDMAALRKLEVLGLRGSQVEGSDGAREGGRSGTESMDGCVFARSAYLCVCVSLHSRRCHAV